MMDKIVVLSHEADMGATDLQKKIKDLTGTEFGIKTVDNKKFIDYGSVKTTTTDDKKTENAICLCVGKGDGWKLTVNSTDVELKVEALTYDKRLYRPGQLDIRLSCTGSKDDIKLVEELKNQLCKYVNEVPIRSSIYFLGNTDSDLIDVCNNYYAHDFSISNEDSNGTIVTKITLHCYSPDKLLTLDKYSKVYCGEGFDTKLFKEMEKQPNNLKLNYETKSLLRVRKAKRYFKREDPLYQIMQTLDKESQQYIILKEEVDKKKDGALEYTPVHFPYLVQYNESFYDFLQRIAVRCGEFLYYENGELTLGISSEKQKRPDKVLDSTKFHIQFPKVNISNAQDPDVKLYTNSAFVSRTEDEKETHDVNGGMTYNMEYTNDDFVKYLDSHDNDLIYEAMYDWEKFINGSCGAVLSKAPNAEAIIPTFLTGFLSAVADVGINKEKFEDEFYKYYQNYNDMMGLSYSSMLTNKFYYNVEMQEKVAQDGTIKLNYSSNIPQLYLCDPVDLDSDKECYYYVSHIHGSIEPKTTVQNEKETITYSRENYAEIIPTLKREDEEIIYSNESKETIDVYTIVPPHYDIPRIRKADPQEAIVKQVDDPRLMGRVRVLYRWQKEETEEKDGYHGSKYKTSNYSPWLKVTVPYSGGTKGGMNMMPEIDDHVMVNFVGGNVDNPYVEGYLFYETSRPPVGAGMIKNKLKAGYQRKVISSSKGHAITFTDITDKSSILNMVCPPVAAVANMVEGIGKQHAGWKDPLCIDEHLAPFTGGITLRDPNGVYELDLSAKNRSIDVKSPFGNVTISAFTGISIDAPNGDVKIRGKNVSIEAGNNLTLSSGTNIRGGNEYKAKTIMKSVGGAMATTAMSVAWNSITAELPWAKELTKLTDLSFLRSTWEIIMRPVEGTLKLQSKRNTIITAGKGKAAVPRENLSDAYVPSNKEFVKFNDKNNQVRLDIVALIDALKNTHDNSYDTYRENMEQMKRYIVDIRAQLRLIQDSLEDDFKNSIALSNDENCYDRIYSKVIHGEELAKWDTVFIDRNPHSDIKTTYNYCAKLLRKAIGAFKDIKEKYKKDYDDSIKKAIKRNTNVNVNLKTNFVEPLWTNTTMFNVEIAQDNNANTIVTKLNEDGTKKKSCRKLIYKFVTISLSDYLTSNVIYNDEDPNEGVLWTNWKDGISSEKGLLKTESSQLGGLVDKLTLGITNFAQSGFYNNPFMTGVAGKLINANGIAGPRSVWGLQQEGQILLSNQNAKTMLLNNNGNGWKSYYPNFYDDDDVDTIKTKLETL